MYITVKVRLKLDSKKKSILLMYENLYHETIENIMNNMIVTKDSSYNSQHVNASIERHTHWNLYQLALRKFNAVKLKKSFQYQRSSTWNPESYSYYNGLLTLYFGTTFQILQLNIPLAIINSEDELISNSRMIRLDITHDEKFWFANFVIQMT